MTTTSTTSVHADSVDTWQTLRRSCEIEWAQHYPQYAVSRWIGHSIIVSGRHYANAIPDELFARAARGGQPSSVMPATASAAMPENHPSAALPEAQEPRPEAAQKAAQQALAKGFSGSQRATPSKHRIDPNPSLFQHLR